MGELVKGSIATGLEPVREAFIATFERDDERKEIGGSLAVYVAGECVVDLWGGHADEEKTDPFTQDTLVNIWSATKGIAAIEVAKLVDEGKLDYDALVVDYWPEYGVKGKGKTTVAQLMSHQAGLPGFSEPITLEEFFDWETATSRLAAQAPMWEPGTKNSYHAMTYGFLAGELVRRASGKSVGRYLREALAEPLDADVWIGLPETEEGRVSLLVPSPIQPDLQARGGPAEMPPEALAAITNPDMDPLLPHQREWRAAEIPAGNGHATGKGIARLYAPLANGGEFEGKRIFKQETIDRLIELQTDRIDILNGIPVYWRMGLTGNVGGVYGPWEDTVGHPGWGGSFGCFSPEHGVAIGYTVKQMGPEAIGDKRATELCNVICACL